MFHCGMVGVVFGSCLYLQEYEQGDVETKRQILSNLDKYGVKNCSWVHQLSKSTKTHNAHTEDVIRNFYTRPLRCMFSAVMLLHCMLLCTLSGSRRSAIFKIEGVDESSLANDDMKQQLLEEILTMCELRFGHARQTQLHDKFDVLSKYYFVHSQGQKQTTGTVEEQTLDSSCTGMKGMQVKDKAAMDIMMGKTSSANRPDPENVSSSFSEASESFKLLLKDKARLAANLEDLKFLKHKMNSLYKNDPVWTKKIEELANACVSLDSFLEDLRAHHANGLPKDAEADCLELAKSLATVHLQALTHDKGGKAMIKTFKAVLDQ